MTMQDVAQLAGVSQATVSRVVNGSSSVSLPVVEQVTRAMRQLGYTPKRRTKSPRDDARPANLSRSRVRPRTDGEASQAGVIALLMLDTSMELHPVSALAKLRGVTQAIAREGLTLSIASGPFSGALPPVLEQDVLLGVLLWGRKLPPALAGPLMHLPCVWLSSHLDARGRRIMSGNEQAGQLAAQHLIERGVRRPAVLCPGTIFLQCEQREHGFRSAMYLAGIDVQVVGGVQSGPRHEERSNIEQARDIDLLVDQLLHCRPQPDGLFVPDDLFVPLIYHSLRRRGIRPMIDIRVVSCGNEQACLSGLQPRPSTIDWEPETVGRLAVEHLMCEIRNPGTSDRVWVLIEPRLIPGEEVEAAECSDSRPLSSC